MKSIADKIECAGHIVLILHEGFDADTIASASAMYGFLLQKHKKVSWFCKSGVFDKRFAFLGWFENIKNSYPLSCDLVICFHCTTKKRLGVEVECEIINIDNCKKNSRFADINFIKNDAVSTTEILYDFFIQESVKINKKMATALYFGLLESSESFLSKSVDGTTFALAHKLIELGADYKSCSSSFVQKNSLASLRLKAIMLKNLSLECDAQIAFFCLNKTEFASSGAELESCTAAMKEALGLAYVKVAILLAESENLTIDGLVFAKDSIDISNIASKIGGFSDCQKVTFSLSSPSIFQAKDILTNLIKKEL